MNGVKKMKRLYACYCFISIILAASFSTNAEESDDSSITSSPPMELELTYSKKVKPPSHGWWQRTAAKVPDIEGNWFVEWHDYPEEGMVERAALTLTKPWEMVEQSTKLDATRWVYNRKKNAGWSLDGWRGENYDYGYNTITPVVSGNRSIEIEHPYFILGHWGGSSTVELVAPDKITGLWKYKDNGGKEIWTKAAPKITRVKFLSDIDSEVTEGNVGRVEKSYDSYWWSAAVDMRGNRPDFDIEIYGENLWGHHVIDLDGAVDLEPRGYSHMWDENALGRPGRIIGLKLEVVIWEQFVPGRKTLFIDGKKIPFDFVVKDYPDTLDAKLKVNIVPRLKKVGDKTHYVDVQITDEDLQISDEFGRITKWLLRREAAKFTKQLKKWAKFLSDVELAKLMSDGKLLVDVRKPYEVLKRFKGKQLKVPVYWKWAKSKQPKKTVELAFVKRGEKDFVEVVRVPRGEPFWIEAEFSEAPEEDKKTITLNWANNNLEVEVERTEELSTLYRSGPFLVNPLSENELNKTR